MESSKSEFVDSKSEFVETNSKCAEELKVSFRKLINVEHPTKEIVEKAYEMIQLGVDPLTTLKIFPWCNILETVIRLGDLNWFKKFVQEFKFDLNNIGEVFALEPHANYSAFALAMHYDAPDIVEWLIENNYVPTERIQYEFRRLFSKGYHIFNEKAVELADILLKHGADVRIRLQYPEMTLVQDLEQRLGHEHAFYKFIKEKFDELDNGNQNN